MGWWARRVGGAMALALVALPLCGQQTVAPAAAGAMPQSYPYVFANFVWWTDAELRRELHKRVRGLGDTVAEGSPQEARLREALEKLLAKKHVQATVQSIHPSSPQGVTFARAAGAPPLSTVFRVLAPPAINVETVTPAPGLPHEMDAEIKRLDHTLGGHAYAADTFWWREQHAQDVLADLGYLTAKVVFAPGAPHGDAQTVLVPLVVSANLGPLFHVGEVTVDGGPLLEGRELKRYAALHPGDVAGTHGFVRLEASMRALYASKGYADVAVDTAPVLDQAKAVANYHVRVVPGTQYRVSAVKIEGLSSAQAGEVRILLGMKRGDVFNERMVGDLYKKIRTSPGLVKQTFGYTVKREKKDGTVELSLEFSPER